MNATTRRRIGAALSAAAITAVGLGLAGAITAGAASVGVPGVATDTHATPAAAMAGTYELYVSYDHGPRFTDEGQLYLNSDSSWSLQNYSDGGTWSTVGQTLGMSDFDTGSPNGAVWGVKVSGTNLGSATSPGKYLVGGGGDRSDLFYAVFTSSDVPAHARSGEPTLAAAVRSHNGSATFPGTYNTFVGGNEYQTVYTSYHTWSLSGGYCDAGTYLNFKVKIGSKITYTDIQADNGCDVDLLWMAKEHGPTKLGTASKPGTIADSPGGVYNHFYAVLAG